MTLADPFGDSTKYRTRLSVSDMGDADTSQLRRTGLNRDLEPCTEGIFQRAFRKAGKALIQWGLKEFSSTMLKITIRLK